MKKLCTIVLILLLTTAITFAGCTEDYGRGILPSDDTSLWETGQESTVKSDLPDDSDVSNAETGESMSEGSKTSPKTSSGKSVGQNTTTNAIKSGAISSKTASGTSTSSDSTTKAPSGGNVIKAAENNGEVAYYDGWVYCLITSTPRMNNYYLYRMREDGSEKVKLVDERVANFYVADGWVYYTFGAIYKIKTDGSGKQKLFSDDLYSPTNILVEDGWIYWINIRKNSSNAYGQIYKMRTDGTGLMQIGSFPENTTDHACNMTVVNGWIYYINWRARTGSGISWSGGYLSKIQTDGKSNSQLHEDIIDFYTVNNDWIFYCNVSDHGKIYKMHTDGTGITKISNHGAYSINIFDNSIYYCGPMDRSTDSLNKTYSIYKMKKDGTEIKEIGSNMLRSIRVINGWVYCINWDFTMYRTRIDGSDKQQMIP